MVIMVTLIASLSSCYYFILRLIFEKWPFALVTSSVRSIRLHCEKELKQFLSPPLEGIVCRIQVCGLLYG